jgi:hypothetical protein
MVARLDLADVSAIIGPINWYGPTSNLKAMFDRLVCMSGGNPREELIAHRNPEQAMRLEKTAEWEELSVNHLEGRSAGFFCYGDEGGTTVARKTCGTRAGSIPRPSHSTTSATRTRRSCGSAAIPASRCRTRSGVIARPGRESGTARTKPKTWWPKRLS